MRFTRVEFWAIGGIALAYFIVILDAGVLNLALLTIQATFGATLSHTQWVLNAYSLPLAALLMSAGRLGDRLGHRRLLIFGVAVFVAASVSAMIAPTLGWLIGARALQGVGGAIMLPATLATIPHAFREGPARSKATVIWVGTGALAMALAPVLGGGLITLWGWRSVFGINLPLGVISIALVVAGMRETPRASSTQLHAGTQILLALVLGTVSGGIVLLGDRTLPRTAGIGLLLLGVTAGVILIIWNRRTSALVPRGYFADPVRAATIISAGGMGFVFYGSFLALSLLLQANGRDAIRTGILLLPMTAASVAGPMFAYRVLSKWLGPKTILIAGFSLATAGAVFLAASDGNPYVIMLVGMITVGAMSTVCFSALTALLMEHTTPDGSGLSSGLQNTTRQAGSLLAYSVVGAILTQVGFSTAMLVVINVCAGCAVLSACADRRFPKG